MADHVARLGIILLVLTLGVSLLYETEPRTFLAGLLFIVAFVFGPMTPLDWDTE
ncbi:hypothetical protein [Haladaptatus sp. DJG-WS-42]|uniref:hypothetical protein n=1 Tax=Haladaptatus sp. DJG-WS-42 TaxID=3120516 RepID=UPI0030D437CB